MTNEIPEDIMQAAREASSYIMNTPDYLTCSIIARVILAERKRSQWQTIDTAPKDGSVIHVISTTWLMPVPAYFLSSQYLYQEYGDSEYMEEGWYPSLQFLFDLPEAILDPTHWMPLPVLPSEE